MGTPEERQNNCNVKATPAGDDEQHREAHPSGLYIKRGRGPKEGQTGRRQYDERSNKKQPTAPRCKLCKCCQLDLFPPAQFTALIFVVPCADGCPRSRVHQWSKHNRSTKTPPAHKGSPSSLPFLRCTWRWISWARVIQLVHLLKNMLSVQQFFHNFVVPWTKNKFLQPSTSITKSVFGVPQLF